MGEDILKLGAIRAKYLELKSIFESDLALYLEELNFESKLPEVFNYSLVNSGKRFRPVLTLAVSESLGQDSKQVLPFCIAVELLHNSSLIHDDLPALDDDSLRRGRDTVHIKYGEAQAILAADALISIAFNCLSHSKVDNPAVIVSWVRDLSDAFTKLCHGQSLDIEEMKGAKSELSKTLGAREIEKQLESRHLFKTGALIKASIMAPLSLLETHEHRTHLDTFSKHLGLLFQITDDIEDYLEVESAAYEHEEATYVSLLGIDGARERASSVASMALDSLSELKLKTTFNTDFLSKLTTALKNRA